MVSFGHKSGLIATNLVQFYRMRVIFFSKVNNGWIQQGMSFYIYIYIYLDICVLTEMCKPFLNVAYFFFIVCAFQSSKSCRFQCQKYWNAIISSVSTRSQG